MPTTAKLVSFVLFAAVLGFAAFNYAVAMPAGMPSSWFVPGAALVGGIFGWRTMGGYVMRKRGLQDAIGTGLRASLSAAAVALVVFAFYDTMLRSMERRYSDFNELFLGFFDRTITLGEAMLTLPVLGVLFFGGAVSGAIALWVARRWT